MESRQALDETREALAAALERATSAEGRGDALTEELTAVRGEVARLSEERASVLAAVDDLGAEPATVIRALRDQVAGLEGQVGVLTAERGALERRSVVETQAAEARLADAHASGEARLAELRRAAQESVDDARRAAEATVAELRVTLADRDRVLAAREQSLRELADEHDRTRRSAVEVGEALRRSQAETERVQAELGNVQAAERDVRKTADGAAERLVALDRELAAARAELDRLHAERNRVLAAVDEPGTEPVAVIRALREQTAALEAQARTLGDERAALVERATSERAAFDARLAAAEQARAEAERLRGEQVSRIAALERDLMRSDEMLASARRQLDAAMERARANAERAAQAAVPVASAAAPVPNAEPAPSLPHVEVLAPPPAPVIEAAGHRILEADPMVRERVAAALGTELPAATANVLFVANLLTALPDRLGELDDAIQSGGTLVTYAADAGRSRILGPVRCFLGYPNPDAMLTMLNKLGAQRRLISLSEDVDGLIPLKGALSKAGHSISMACDPKQALDLLGMLTPDAVVVDVRHAPEAAATFLDALALENGRTPTFLVTGDQPGTTLRRMLDPLLRPVPLDATALAKVCETVLQPPAADGAARAAAPRVVRPIDRTKTAVGPATRKPLARRVLTTKRR
jgi:chromosome segregation ATPase